MTFSLEDLFKAINSQDWDQIEDILLDSTDLNLEKLPKITNNEINNFFSSCGWFWCDTHGYIKSKTSHECNECKMVVCDGCYQGWPNYTFCTTCYYELEY